jgi:hypothetical protein
MSKIKITVENDLGESVFVNSYELGTGLDKMDKLEKAISAVSGPILTDITASMISLEEKAFLKKTLLSLTGATR